MMGDNVNLIAGSEGESFRHVTTQIYKKISFDESGPGQIQWLFKTKGLEVVFDFSHLCIHLLGYRYPGFIEELDDIIPTLVGRIERCCFDDEVIESRTNLLCLLARKNFTFHLLI